MKVMMRQLSGRRLRRLMLLAAASIVFVSVLSEASVMQPVEKTLSVAFMFRQHAADDLAGALSIYAFEAERGQWEGALRTVLPDDDHAFYFFSGSYVVLGPQTSTAAVVGFYHLWSDVLLLTCFDITGAPRVIGLGWRWLAAPASAWDLLAPDFTGRAWSAGARAEQVTRVTQPWAGQLPGPPQQSAEVAGLRERIGAHIQRTPSPPAGLDPALDRAGGEAVADVLWRSAEGRLMELPVEVFGTPAQQAQMRSWYARPQSRMIGWQPAMLSLTPTHGAVVLANSIDPAEMLWVGLTVGGRGAQVGGVRFMSLRDATTGSAPDPPSIATVPPSPPATPTPLRGQVVICRSVEDGQPVGVGAAFEQLPEITLLHRYQDATAGAAEAAWFRDGEEIVRSVTHVQAGKGWVEFRLLSGDAPLLPTGRYEVELLMPGQAPVRTAFTIEQTEIGGQTGPTIPAPAPTPTLAPAPTPVEGVDAGQRGDFGSVSVGTGFEAGRATGTADHFDHTDTVVAVIDYANIPRGSTAVAIWTCDGEEFARGEKDIGGNGSASFGIRTRGRVDMAPGRYTVTVIVGETVLGRNSFTIGTRQEEIDPPQPTPTPAPAPTTTPTFGPVPNLSGDWKINANNFRSTLSLEHVGNRLTGRTFSVPIANGRVLDDGTVAFTRTDVNQTYTGTFSVEPDGTWKLSGTFDWRANDYLWVATRDPSGGEAPTPTLPAR